jgi:hypothetical protein
MAGFFENGFCYPTAEQAIDTHYQSQPTFSAFNGSTNFVFNYVRAADGVWSLNRTDFTTGKINNLTLPPLNFQACDSPNDTTTSYLNGMELGWEVSVIIVIAFCLRRLRRGF